MCLIPDFTIGVTLFLFFFPVRRGSIKESQHKQVIQNLKSLISTNFMYLLFIMVFTSVRRSLDQKSKSLLSLLKGLVDLPIFDVNAMSSLSL